MGHAMPDMPDMPDMDDAMCNMNVSLQAPLCPY